MHRIIYLSLFAASLMLASLAVVLPGAHAQSSVSLVQYTFPGIYPNISLAPTLLASNVIADDVNFTGSISGMFQMNNALAVVPAGTSTTAASAVANNSYIQFTVMPGNGYALNLSHLDFETFYGGTNAGWVLRSSVNGFSTNISAISSMTNTSFTHFSANLSSAAYQNQITPITFRFYSYGQHPIAPDVVYDNINLQGTVTAVPEASTLPLLFPALALAAAIIRRKKRLL